MPVTHYNIRHVRPEECAELGQLIVAVYAGLPGMPMPSEQPVYYGMLADVAKRVSNPAINVYVAVSNTGTLLGSVDFITDMMQYGSGGPAGTVVDAAGVRLLAVSPAARGMGIGKALMHYCLTQAQALGKAKVVLHTTRTMQTAWTMYERMGFSRFPEIDFQQDKLEVFGFQLELKPAVSTNELAEESKNE